MTDTFDKDYWDSHWQRGSESASDVAVAPNPYLERELGRLTPGTALEAGCGEGAEATWLARRGWQVTAVDISTEALSRAAALRDAAAVAERLEWVEADLGSWQPIEAFDLVTTFYAHPTQPQLSFYARIADWVAPGGTLLIVGHRSAPADDPGRSHDHAAPERVSVTAASVAAVLDAATWQVVTAEEGDRTLVDRTGQPLTLHDVVVRAMRRELMSEDL